MRLSLIGIALLVVCISSAKGAGDLLRVLLKPAGIVEIEGRDYTSETALKAKLEEIKHRNPAPTLHIDIGRQTDLPALVPAFNLLGRCGVKIGFITEPKSN